jgi:hypothetical protein
MARPRPRVAPVMAMRRDVVDMELAPDFIGSCRSCQRQGKQDALV